ncbi:MAG: STAS domain-containing protein [Chloroflexales bacterium]
MDLNISEHIVRTVVVAPRQRIDAFNAPELRAALDQQLEGGARRFVLDLTNVPFLDSAGMAVLVRLLKRSRDQGGDVRLVWPTEEAARRIIKLTKFDRVFTMADTAEAALTDF